MQIADWRAWRFRFNSSVGILVVRTSSSLDLWARSPGFQFLGRNSGRSDLMQQFFDPYLLAIVSIPRSEFWSFGRLRVIVNLRYSWRFQFLGRNSGRSDRGWRTDGHCIVGCFNSSVGILVVRTFYTTAKLPKPSGGFQFLGRNSGRSDVIVNIQQQANICVSIPRSEFWSFGPDTVFQKRMLSC